MIKLFFIFTLFGFLSACGTTQKQSYNKHFTPLLKSAIKDSPSSGDLNNAPWEIPENYSQDIVIDESTLDIYPEINDWPDMVTLNESGADTERYLYRSHEIRPIEKLFGEKTTEENITKYQDAGGGVISVVDLKTNKAKILIQSPYWEAVDGIIWTPWKTLLITQETKNKVITDPSQPQAESGLVYEILLDQNDLMNEQNTAQAIARPLLGALAHEGIEVDDNGAVYVIDEDYEGSIYKFIPDIYGNLSSGNLSVLKLSQETSDKTGPATWIPLDMSKIVVNAQEAAKDVNASSWCRPEDLEIIGQTLYVASTCHERDDDDNFIGNRVLAINLDGTPHVSNFILAGVNVPEENLTSNPGFQNPDNLAKGPDKTLWIIEDNSPSDIWVASLKTDLRGYSEQVYLFASLADAKAEGTGIYFTKDFKTLFVNIQHSGTGNDKTMKIRQIQH